MQKSSLASKADRSLRHVRWSKDDTGWGGDEEVTLTQVAVVPGRVEWVEGDNSRWDLWVFQESASIIEDDILLIDDLDMALRVDRVATFTKLKGQFHHYEILTEEHEMSRSELAALL